MDGKFECMTTTRDPSVSRSVRHILCILMGLAGATIVVGPARADDANIEVRENVVYGKASDDELTLHLARPVDAKNLPGVLIIHRGGWVGGSKDRYRQVIQDFAKHGYVAASVGYRFAPKHRFPAQIEDCKCAVRWMRANAAELGVDPQRIGAMGESAGGYLSLMLGALDPADGMEGEGGWKDQSSKVQAVVSFYGPTDLRWESFATNPPAGFRGDIAKRLLFAYIGADPEKNSELLYKASPVKYVDAGDAPTMLLQGTDDPLVLASQTEIMMEALSKAGVKGRAEFIFGTRHDWDGEEFEEPLARAREFLDEQLKTKETPTLGPERKWNPELAAQYLDARAKEWNEWPRSARSHETRCISCHTTLPYLLVRSELGRRIGEKGQPEPAKKLYDDIRRRVDAWAEVKPWYASTPEKPEQSMGTEAVINSFLLAASDAFTPHLAKRSSTKAALNNLWGAQRKDGPAKGSWAWLDFELHPWEFADAELYGASLAAIAVGITPRNEQERAANAEQEAALRDYLRTGIDPSKSSLLNRTMILWASFRLPGLLEKAEQEQIGGELIRAQRPDGSWSLSDLGEWPTEHAESDAYATGLCAYVLNHFWETQYTGAARRGAKWLSQNQDPATGAWPAKSLDQNRDPNTMAGKFMQDAATAFAVLALTDMEW